MSNSFDLTATEQLSADEGEDVTHLALKVRNHDNSRFDGTYQESQVIEELLQQRLEELNEGVAEAAEKQREVRERLELTDEGNTEEEPESHVERKQAEIRERITG